MCPDPSRGDNLADRLGEIAITTKMGTKFKAMVGKLFRSEKHEFRILHNLAANSVAQLINVFGQLVTVPIFLSFWGKELYGEWILLSTIPAYFAMNDVGFASVGATEMTVLVAQNKREAAREVFQSIWGLVTLTSLGLFGVLAGVFAWLPICEWLHITQLTGGEVALVTLLLLGQVVISQQTGLLQAGFRCEGATALGVSWNNASRMSELLLTAAMVALRGGPLAVAVTVLGARLAGAVLMRAHLYRICPWLVIGWRHAHFTQVRRLAGPAFAFMAFPLGHALKNQGIVMVIGRCLGPVAVVVFTTARTLTNVAYQLMGIIHLSVWPEMSAAFGAGNIARAKSLHRHSCRASFWLALAAATGLFFCGGWIYQIWTRGEVGLNLPLFYVLLTVIAASSLWYTSSVVPMAINCHQRTAMWYLGGTGVALLVAIMTVPRWGVVAAGSALLVIDVVMLLHVLPSSLELVHDRFVEFVLAVLRPPYTLAPSPRR